MPQKTTQSQNLPQRPQDLFDISGKSVLVTGANGTLGRTVSLALAAAGAKLTLAGEGADEMAALNTDITAIAQSEPVILDLRPDTEDRAEQIVDAAVVAHRRLDIVIVASGVNRVAPVTEMPVADWDSVIEANTTGPWLICRAAGRQMIAQRRAGPSTDRSSDLSAANGKIVLVSSTRGRHGHDGGYSAYCASKAAVDGLVRALACEWGTHAINVNAIGPTVFRSNLTSWMYEADGPGKAVREGMLARIPLGRLGEPDDLVGAIMFLVSPASDFCTGQTLYVDGGYTAS